MRIPMKVDYGVRALIELAQHTDSGKLVRTAEIAERQGIPEAYLDQVLTTLNKFGFIRSRRGPQGGHILARPSLEITLDEVVATLEGRTPPLECLDGDSGCALSDCCAQRDTWKDVEDAINAVLTTTSIGALALRQRKKTVQQLNFIGSSQN
ncbi:MAG: AsnC family transcriptional regulator [Chloroflexi bacterium]|nr:AsnC family transcriptional regulator [Chloroflexota bacterium]MQF87029.1 Rrf2 family transcriptional regulator [SAR202 cluster bacterium]